MTDPTNFLEKIWALQRTDGAAWGFTSKKNWNTGEWRDYPTQEIDDIDLSDPYDVYFAPVLFSRKRRQKQFALSSRILYADLDAVNPDSLKDVYPSLAWQTSPGRYQAAWILDRSLSPDRFERLNRRLTYYTGADKGGWACVKVLRVPGTISTKYGKSRAKRFTVELVGRGHKYKVEDLQALLPRADATRSVNIKGIFGSAAQSLPDHRAVMDKWISKMPMRAKRLLKSKGAEGDDRSARLWEIYNLLLQTGVPPNHILVLVKECAFNKYKGQRREITQLRTEIAKAAEQFASRDDMDRLVGSTSSKKNKTGRNGRKKPKLRGKLAKQAEARMEKNPKELKFLTEEEFMQMHFPKPEWLIDGFWSKGAYGVCVGEYKAFKTTILLNMAVSVASGKSFLEEGRFKVKEPGLVLYLHEEGRQGSIQGLLHRIKMRKGLGPSVQGRETLRAPVKLPLHVSSFTGFKLSDEKCQEQLVRYIDKRKPKLIIMESWYLLASEIDENSAGEVAPILDWITKVSQDFGCGIIISHHYNKDKETKGRRAIDRISGSGVFGRWFESAIALERTGSEEDYQASIEAFHREQKGVPKQTLRVEMDGDDEDDYNITFVDEDVEIEHTTSRVVDRGTQKKRDKTKKETIALGYLKNQLQDQEYLKFFRVVKTLSIDRKRLGRIAREGGYTVTRRDVGTDGKEIWVIEK